MFGAELPLAARFVIAFLIVIALIAITAWLINRFGGPRLGASNARGRQPRLAVLDATAVDSRRKLVLVRRDNVEHLLLIGGPTDVVVEPHIVRAVPMPSHDIRRPPGMEGQTEVAAGHDQRRPPMDRPTPDMMANGEGDQFAPHPTLPLAPAPQTPAPPRSTPPAPQSATQQPPAREPDLLNDRLGAALRRPFAARPSEAPAAGEAPLRRPPPPLDAAVAPPAPTTLPAEAAAIAEPPPVSGRPIDIANAIEDVLAIQGETSSASAPRVEPTLAEPAPVIEPPRRAPIFGQRPASPATPARVEPTFADKPSPAPLKPAAKDAPTASSVASGDPAKEVTGKSVFDSLEQEMASLLGRAPGKEP